jgi:hypothetical protein
VREVRRDIARLKTIGRDKRTGVSAAPNPKPKTARTKTAKPKTAKTKTAKS